MDVSTIYPNLQMFLATLSLKPHLPARKHTGSISRLLMILLCKDAIFVSCSSSGKLHNMLFFSLKSSSKGGVFQGWQCAPISHFPSFAIPLKMLAAAWSVATG